MILNEFNNIYTNIGAVTITGLFNPDIWCNTKVGETIQSPAMVGGLTPDYEFSEILSAQNIGKVDTYFITLENGMTTTLPGTYQIHTEEHETKHIHGVDTGDTLLLSGMYPDVDTYAFLRVPASLHDLGYMQVGEELAEIAALIRHYGVYNSKDITLVLKSIPAESISNEAILHMKNYGSVVLKHITNKTVYFTIKIVNPDYIDMFVSMNAFSKEGIPRIISTSPLSVVKAYIKVYLAKMCKNTIIVDDIKTLSALQALLLTRFGIYSILDRDNTELILAEDWVVGIKELSPFQDRYDDVLVINDAFSLIKEKITSIKKFSLSSVKLLLADEKVNTLLIDNIY